MKGTVHKVAFIVPEFPAVSLTFITNQIADLIDRGIEVEVFALRKGSEENVSDRYFKYDIKRKTHYLAPPHNKIKRVCLGLFVAARIIAHDPRIVFRALSPAYGYESHALFTLFWVYPFMGKKFDVVHCHFGTVATKYLKIRSILNDSTPFITTFYGYDVSHTPQVKGVECYKELASKCSMFFVMSEDMKMRVEKLFIPKEKITVLPVSIDTGSFTFKERVYKERGPINMISVGRFVEKKGFDDLIRALAIVKKNLLRPFKLRIIGDGELHDEIHTLARELHVEDVIEFKGFMQLEEILKQYETSDLYLQPSKTARNGDME